MVSNRIIKEVKIHSISLVDIPLHPSCTIKIIDSERGRSPMLETTRYIRKKFDIDAVQVTGSNIEEIAKWVDGEVRSESLGQYVKVRVHRPLNDRQTKAYIGDWVLYAGTGYKVYTPKAFANSFEQVSNETTFVDTDNMPKRKNNGASANEVEDDDIVSVVEGNVVVPKRVATKKKVD